MDNPYPVLLFDGVCNLCAATVRFVLPRDRSSTIRFAAMQSPAGQAILRDLNLPATEFESVLFIEGGQVHAQSVAALRVARYLGAPWRQAAWVARAVPRPMADWLYRRVARNRYRMFGRRTTCLVPTDAQRGRFLE